MTDIHADYSQKRWPAIFTALATCPQLYHAQDCCSYTQCCMSSVTSLSLWPGRILETVANSSITNQSLLSLQPSHTVIGACHFLSCAPKVWNSLPNNVQSASSLTSLKAELKTHHFNTVFNW